MIDIILSFLFLLMIYIPHHHHYYYYYHLHCYYHHHHRHHLKIANFFLNFELILFHFILLTITYIIKTFILQEINNKFYND
jgi:hypothetical protein